jgi:hypothetical protein
VGKLEGTRPPGRPKLRRENNIKMPFQEWNRGHGIGCYDSG